MGRIIKAACEAEVQAACKFCADIEDFYEYTCICLSPCGSDVCEELHSPKNHLPEDVPVKEEYL